MIKVEVDHVRKLKEMQQREKSKCRLALSKNVTSSGEMQERLKSQESRRQLEASYGKEHHQKKRINNATGMV